MPTNRFNQAPAAWPVAVTEAKILVAHRDQEVLSWMARALRDSGFVVTTAHDGAHALESAKQTRFDVLVLGDGLEDLSLDLVCREVRSLGTQGPIMAVVARGREELIAALDAGADASLTEPISMDELFARVRALLRRYWPERAHAP